MESILFKFKEVIIEPELTNLIKLMLLKANDLLVTEIIIISHTESNGDRQVNLYFLPEDSDESFLKTNWKETYPYLTKHMEDDYKITAYSNVLNY